MRQSLLLVNVTMAPPAGAAADNVAVPVEAEPPCTELGFTDTEASAAVCVAVVSKTTSTQ